MLNLFDALKHWATPDDIDSSLALSMRHTPWVGSLAYFHTLFRPTSSDVLGITDCDLKLPESLKEFYQMCNGAWLFQSNLCIYGCVKPGTLLDRSNPFSLPPIDVVSSNRSLVAPGHQDRVLAIASYHFDRSLVCVDRIDETVACYAGEDLTRKRAEWPSIDEWLRDELERLPLFFTSEGQALASSEQMLPRQHSRRN